METNLIKVILPSFIAFVIGILVTPILTKYLYKYKLWKKKVKTVSIDGGETPIFKSLHAEREVNTPRMGGIIIWISTIITTLFFGYLVNFFRTVFFQN